MAVTPDTTIRLLKVPIEIDNMNQLTFANDTAQYNYFHGLTGYLEEEDLQYQRKDNYIMFPAHIDSILEYNYCMYQNSNYSNKWFYAFITKMEYENDGVTRIYIETDCFQSWQFDIIYKQSFIEREHVNDDTIGVNLIPENLQLGEYVTNKKTFRPSVGFPTTDYIDNCSYVIGVTETFNTSTNTWEKVNGTQYGGTYFPFKYFAFDVSTDTSSLNYFINVYNMYNKESAIVCVFMIHNSFISVNTSLEPLERYVIPSQTPNVVDITEDSTEKDFTTTTLDTYVPINNKLKTYPYLFLGVSNNAGSDVIYRYENFYTYTNNVKTITTSPSFKFKSTLTPSGSARLIPVNYKGEAENELEGINLGKYPILGWQNDIYTNWLTQNAVNIPLSIGGSLLASASGVIAGNPIGVVSGVLGVANTLGEIYKESLMSPQAEGNINAGDIITATKRNVFTFEVKSIKKEMAKIIDDYFSCYGYKVNATKTPNITGRTNWNYVKTINANIEGDIPQEDLQKIKDILNNGVTFWHNPLTFLDYSQSNAII